MCKLSISEDTVDIGHSSMNRPVDALFYITILKILRKDKWMEYINKYISQTADQTAGFVPLVAGSLPGSGHKTGGHTSPLSPGEHSVHLG